MTAHGLRQLSGPVSIRHTRLSTTASATPSCVLLSVWAGNKGEDPNGRKGRSGNYYPPFSTGFIYENVSTASGKNVHFLLSTTRIWPEPED